MRWIFESEDAAGAYHARNDLVAYLGEHASDDSDVAAAELIFGELVGNVVRHAPGPISCSVDWREGIAVLSVRDQGPGFEWICSTAPELFAESGRGLFIIQATARAFLVERLPGKGTKATAWLPVLRRPYNNGR